MTKSAKKYCNGVRDGLRGNQNYIKLREEGMKYVRGDISHCCRKHARERPEKLKKVLEDLKVKVTGSSENDYCIVKCCHDLKAYEEARGFVSYKLMVIIGKTLQQVI